MKQLKSPWNIKQEMILFIVRVVVMLGFTTDALAYPR